MRHSIILSLLFLSAGNVRAGCYFPDGTIDKNVEYQPCSQDPSNPLSTICCATNRKDGADICAPNGLCQVGIKKGSPPADAAWTKPSCTNQDWTEDGCLHVCGTDKYPFLTPCNRAAGNESQRLCCGMSQDCCNEDSGLSIEYLPITFDPRNFTDASAPASSSSKAASKATTSAAIPTTTSSSSTETSLSTTPASHSTASASPASSSLPTAVPAPQPSSTGLSTGTKAGLGIGISGAALALIGIGILWGRRRRKSAYASHPASDAPPFEKHTTVYAHWDASQGGTSHEGSVMLPPPTPPPREDDEVQIHEMPVHESRGELDAGPVAGVKTKEVCA